MRQRIVFITGHYWASKRKAGFHWLADAFLRRGWEVLFITTSLSLLSIPRLDHRLKYGVLQELNRLEQKGERLWSYVAGTLLHPANLRIELLNSICTPIFQDYASQVNLDRCRTWLQQADFFIFECTAGLMLLDRIKQLNPTARYLYRVSDDLRFMRSHPVLLAAEEESISQFDLVSTPSPRLQSILAGKNRRLHLEFHGIRKDLFDHPWANPFQGPGPHIIFSGIAYLDLAFIDIASRYFSTWKFHIIGPIRNLPKRSNVLAYGELPFVDTVPYIKHADIGLQALTYRPGAEAFTHSLKTLQYAYCQLPIVAPNYLQTGLDHWCFYEADSEKSIITALQQAASYPRLQISRADISSWDEIVLRWCRELALNESKT